MVPRPFSVQTKLDLRKYQISDQACSESYGGTWSQLAGHRSGEDVLGHRASALDRRQTARCSRGNCLPRPVTVDDDARRKTRSQLIQGAARSTREFVRSRCSPN